MHARRLPIEMWSAAPGFWLDKKNYRSVRVCSNVSLPPAPLDAAPASTPRAASVAGGASTVVGPNTAADGAGTCLKYTVWCIPATNRTRQFSHRELYDLGSDPREINNRHVCSGQLGLD